MRSFYFKSLARHSELDGTAHLVSRQHDGSNLPSPLKGTREDSFVHHTIVNRWPRIAQRVLDENNFPARINEKIARLRDELPNGSIRPLDDPGAPDVQLWDRNVRPHLGKCWLEVPWLFGEFYFYRRILEATGYFRPDGAWRRDPFAYQKEEGLRQATDKIRALADRRAEARSRSENGRAELVRLFRGALWGNQADLSMWGADESSPDHSGTVREKEHLLVNDIAPALEHLWALDRPARVDVWADNAGFELVSDFTLVDGFLANPRVATVVVHLKTHPTFVSDATIDDVYGTLDALSEIDARPVRVLASRLRQAMGNGRLRLRDDWVWTSGTPARDLPAPVCAELARSDLLISKGDANYRRLLGDREWDYTTPFETASASLPIPVVALRTLKSEVMAGLTSEQVEWLHETDPDWLVDGEWGVIQYAPAASSSDPE